MQRAFWTTLGTLFLMALMAGVAGHLAANVQRDPGPQQLAWVGRDGRVLDRIGQPLDSITGVAISADASRIAVRGRLDGNDDIWICDVASGSRTRVTDHEAAERHPGWTPDGRISYFSYRNGPADLYVRQADGSGAEEDLVIAPHHQYAPTWSPDGRYVVFHEHNETPTDATSSTSRSATTPLSERSSRAKVSKRYLDSRRMDDTWPTWPTARASGKPTSRRFPRATALWRLNCGPVQLFRTVSQP